MNESMYKKIDTYVRPTLHLSVPLGMYVGGDIILTF